MQSRSMGRTKMNDEWINERKRCWCRSSDKQGWEWRQCKSAKSEFRLKMFAVVAVGSLQVTNESFGSDGKVDYNNVLIDGSMLTFTVPVEY